MDRKLRVLVITYLPWRDDVNVGNSYSNIFGGMGDRMEFAHVYFRDENPDNGLVHRYFHVSEKGLLRSIWDRRAVGREFFLEDPRDGKGKGFSEGYDRLRRMRWELFLLGRDMIGRMGRWKSAELDRFVLGFRPDVMFGTLGYVPVVNRMMVYLKSKFGIPLVTYPWDDYYSWKRVSFSPFFWVRTLSERRLIRRCARSSEFLYTITGKMREEYGACFRKECKVLRKGYLFDEGERPGFVPREGGPIRLVFMGNIGCGRWKVLAEVSRAIAGMNAGGRASFFMDVYTLSPVSGRMSASLNVDGASRLNAPVPSGRVLETMRGADVLLHVEPTGVSDRSFFRLSFSTKLVDYFRCGRCIVALGGDTASMDYLREEDAAIVENDVRKIGGVLERIAGNPALLAEYAGKAWRCGRDNHDIREIREMVYGDLSRVARLKKG